MRSALPFIPPGPQYDGLQRIWEKYRRPRKTPPPRPEKPSARLTDTRHLSRLLVAARGQ
jgi:hypothetical protein